jgi:hypothetical protein
MQPFCSKALSHWVWPELMHLLHLPRLNFESDRCTCMKSKFGGSATGVKSLPSFFDLSIGSIIILMTVYWVEQWIDLIRSSLLLTYQSEILIPLLPVDCRWYFVSSSLKTPNIVALMKEGNGCDDGRKFSRRSRLVPSCTI